MKLHMFVVCSLLVLQGSSEFSLRDIGMALVKVENGLDKMVKDMIRDVKEIFNFTTENDRIEKRHPKSLQLHTDTNNTAKRSIDERDKSCLCETEKAGSNGRVVITPVAFSAQVQTQSQPTHKRNQDPNKTGVNRSKYINPKSPSMRKVISTNKIVKTKNRTITQISVNSVKQVIIVNKNVIKENDRLAQGKNKIRKNESNINESSSSLSSVEVRKGKIDGAIVTETHSTTVTTNGSDKFGNVNKDEIHKILTTIQSDISDLPPLNIRKSKDKLNIVPIRRDKTAGELIKCNSPKHRQPSNDNTISTPEVFHTENKTVSKNITENIIHYKKDSDKNSTDDKIDHPNQLNEFFSTQRNTCVSSSVYSQTTEEEIIPKHDINNITVNRNYDVSETTVKIITSGDESNTTQENTFVTTSVVSETNKEVISHNDGEKIALYQNENASDTAEGSLVPEKNITDLTSVALDIKQNYVNNDKYDKKNTNITSSIKLIVPTNEIDESLSKNLNRVTEITPENIREKIDNYENFNISNSIERDHLNQTDESYTTHESTFVPASVVSVSKNECTQNTVENLKQYQKQHLGEESHLTKESVSSPFLEPKKSKDLVAEVSPKVSANGSIESILYPANNLSNRRVLTKENNFVEIKPISKVESKTITPSDTYYDDLNPKKIELLHRSNPFSGCSNRAIPTNDTTLEDGDNFNENYNDKYTNKTDSNSEEKTYKDYKNGSKEKNDTYGDYDENFSQVDHLNGTNKHGVNTKEGEYKNWEEYNGKKGSNKKNKTDSYSEEKNYEDFNDGSSEKDDVYGDYDNKFSDVGNLNATHHYGVETKEGEYKNWEEYSGNKGSNKTNA